MELLLSTLLAEWRRLHPKLVDLLCVLYGFVLRSKYYENTSSRYGDPCAR